jgi:protein lifeguard
MEPKFEWNRIGFEIDRVVVVVVVVCFFFMAGFVVVVVVAVAAMIQHLCICISCSYLTDVLCSFCYSQLDHPQQQRQQQWTCRHRRRPRYCKLKMRLLFLLLLLPWCLVPFRSVFGREEIHLQQHHHHHQQQQQHHHHQQHTGLRWWGSNIHIHVDSTVTSSSSPSHSLPLDRSTLLVLRGGGAATPPFRAPARTVGDIYSRSSRRRGRSFTPTTTTNTNTNTYNEQERDDDNFKEKSDNSDVSQDSVKEMIDAFLTRDSRNTFIARVYAILSGQLLFTAMVCILFGTLEPLTNISRINTVTGQYANSLVLVPMGGILLSTVAWFRMAAVPQARQQSPNKWWWMAAFTIGEALSLGCLSSLYQLHSVLMAMLATAVASISVSAYTVFQKNAKYDLSQWGATLSSWAMILLVYLLVGLAQELHWLPFPLIPYTDMAYSVFASFLFSLFLAHHTKLIVGGKHAKYRMNEKDYVFGAMTLYVDIVNIFLNILQLIGEDRKS